ncbi:MAG: F0F1 ATP synthase subunit A [Bacteroidales bacterium]|nr:F0F1 ATP synthase subunit A [Bacteroidales bacterium]
MDLLKKALLAIILVFSSFTLFAQEDTTKSTFKLGPFIMNHIGDAYEWHIATINETHVSVPLPCILYSENSGFHVFCSSNFHHGEQSYEGFQISKSEKYNGKIVEIINGEEVRPWDFSITKNVFAMFFSMILLCIIFIGMAKNYKKNIGKAPKGFYNLVEPLILFIRDDIAIASIGKKHADKYMPFLMTVFFFIFLNNLLGLIPIFPGGANLTGNIAITCVLACFTFVITTFSGKKEYWQDIFWPKGVPIWLKIPPIIPAVEIMGVFTKPIVLMVRLFANISGGHIIVLSFFSLIFMFQSYAVGAGSLVFTIFMSCLELLVAFIQAYVFTLLSAIYFGMAVAEEHEETNEVVKSN